jgi:hypothetical protein
MKYVTLPDGYKISIWEESDFNFSNAEDEYSKKIALLRILTEYRDWFNDVGLDQFNYCIEQIRNIEHQLKKDGIGLNRK